MLEKKFNKFLSLILAIFALTISTALFADSALSVEEMLSAEINLSQASLREKLVGKRVFELLFSSHYQKLKITPEISVQWYENYFKFLDYKKMYFLQSDLDEFRSYESILWNTRTRSVNLDFAFAVYKRYLERIHQWANFSIKCLEEEHDFGIEEYMPLLDSDELNWCPNIEVLQDLWRLQTKNMLLLEKLSEEARKENNEETEAKRKISWEDDSFIERQRKTIARHYKRRVEYEPIQILEVFLSSLAQLFDPHSVYMAPQTKDNFDIDMSLSLQGIGATLTTVGPYTVVDSIISGGPADKNGQLKEGDRIVAVAQENGEAEDVIDMPLNRVVSKIRGPKNTVVHLTVLPEGSNSKQIIDITRDEIKLTDQAAQAYTREIEMDAEKARILVIYLPTFYSDFNAKSRKDENYTSSSRDVLKHLQEAQKEGNIDGLILDLRGNGGGSLDEAVKLAGLFLEGGPVVQVKYFRGKIEKMGNESQKAAYNGPITVLVDKFSASASEIVAACLQDTGRALVIGEKSTHGKGTVQTVYDLERDPQIRLAAKVLGDQATGSIKFTIGKFYRVNGSSTQVKGVTPDLVFPAFSDHMDVGEARLTNVMPWDEIPEAKYNQLKNGDITEVNKEELQAIADEFMQKEEAFQEYLQDLKFYEALRKEKKLPLEINARKEFQKREKEAAAMYRKFHAERKKSRRSWTRNKTEESETEKSSSEKSQDLVLDASLVIMGKLLSQ